jgi:predicted RNA binding protein YcfA (HicA-like mRNA interferase family)
MRTRKVYNNKEFTAILKKNGFVLERTKGSHSIYYNSDTHRHMTVAHHLNRMVCERLIKENNLLTTF